MAYDPARFGHAYDLSALPLDVGGWALVSVTSDRVRAAIDLRLTRGERALTVFVERRVADGRCFATTGRLAVSYYAEPGVDDAEAARVTRALTDRLAEAERRGGPELDDALTVVHGRSVTGRARTLELRINRECNERCLFCNTPEDSDTILPGPAAVYSAITRERAAGYHDVTFTGREPTLDPELPSYVRAARDAGYETIRVQTNGSSFAAGPILERLVEAGMNTVEMSLHTLDAHRFDRLIGPPSLLAKTLVALGRLAEAHPSVRVHLVVVLTRLNLGDLSGVLERVAAVHPGVQQITVSPMAPVGDGVARVHLVPRLWELEAPLRAAFEVARRHRLRVTIPSRCGAPLCAMPAGTERFNGEIDNQPGLTLEAGKSKPVACRACVHDPVCTGLWNGYRAHYGDDDVRPVRAG